MGTAAIRSGWVGRVVDGKYPLHEWLGGSSPRGAFLTDSPEPASHQAAIVLVPAVAEDADACGAGWKLATTLDHPYLLRAFHTGQWQIDFEPLLYVVTEYSEENLAHILPERPLTTTETREMLAPVLDALSYLHERGIVHGDLKPSNIVVVENQVKLAWESLHVMGETSSHSDISSVYDAPENDTEPAATAADIWSLGIVLVEALTQHPPAWSHTSETDPVIPDSIPQPFLEIARKCLRFDPAKRCTLHEVQRMLEGRPSTPEIGPTVEPAGRFKLNRRLATILGAAIVLLAVFTIAEMRPGKQAPPAAVQEPAPTTTEAPATTPPTSSPDSAKPAPATHTASQEAASQSPPSQAPAIQTPAIQTPIPQPSSAAGSYGSVTHQVMPEVLPSASRTIQGEVNVRIRVDVDPAGDVSNATFESEGPSRYFSRISMQAAQRWKFKPAQADGKAVPSVWTLRFKFRRSGTEVDPREVSPPTPTSK